MLVTDCLRHSHHCVGQGASEASSLTYPYLNKTHEIDIEFHEVSYEGSEFLGLKADTKDISAVQPNFER